MNRTFLLIGQVIFVLALFGKVQAASQDSFANADIKVAKSVSRACQRVAKSAGPSVVRVIAVKEAQSISGPPSGQSKNLPASKVPAELPELFGPDDMKNLYGDFLKALHLGDIGTKPDQ